MNILGLLVKTNNTTIAYTTTAMPWTSLEARKTNRVGTIVVLNIPMEYEWAPKFLSLDKLFVDYPTMYKDISSWTNFLVRIEAIENLKDYFVRTLVPTKCVDKINGVTTVIDTPNIDSIEYRLSSFNGKEIPIDQDYILTVTPTNLSIKFCNNMSGNYTVNDSSMIQGTVTSTLMFCDEPENIMTMESSFGTLINEGASLALDGESTTIYSKDNTVRFSFKPIAQ